MSTLDRYISRTFARNLALMLLILTALYGLIEFLEKVDDFIEYHAEPTYYLLYPLWKLPVIISDTLPMAILLATFATVIGLSRSSQLTAMYSCGIGFKCICRPLFLFSLGLAALVMVASLWLVPWSSREANYLLRTEIRGSDSAEAPGRDIYFRDGNRIISVKQVFPAKSLVLGLTILEFNDQFKPGRRLQAEMAEYVSEGQWRLKNVTSWDFSTPNSNGAAFHRQSELLLNLRRRASGMLKISARPEDMTINELFYTAEKLRNEGYDAKAYQVEAQLRFSRTAIPVIMVLVGIPFALQRGRDASVSLGVVLSLIIFACYFFLHASFAVFGVISVLPPLVAAWAANLLMALVGTWFLLRIGD